MSGYAQTTEIFTTSQPITSQLSWIISVVVSCLLIAGNCWITVCFVHYAFASKMFKRHSNKDMNRGLVFKTALLATVLPNARYIPTLLISVVGLYESDAVCETIMDISIAGLAVGLVPIYLFLWTRQRAFYGHPTLKESFGKWVSIASKFSLVFILIQALVGIILGIYWDEYDASKSGCALKNGKEIHSFRTYLYAGILVSSQMVLLGLFLYPLYLNYRAKERMTGRERAAENISSQGGASERQETSFSISESPAQRENKLHPKENDSTQEVATTNSADVTNIGEEATDSKPGTSGTFDRSGVTNQGSTYTIGTVLTDISTDSPIRKLKSLPQTYKAEDSPKWSLRQARVHTVRAAAKAANRFKKMSTNMRKRRGDKRLYKLIKRTLFLALISVIADISSMIISLITSDKMPQSLSFVIYDISLFISVVTVVASFENWRAIMTSPFINRSSTRSDDDSQSLS